MSVASFPADALVMRPGDQKQVKNARTDGLREQDPGATWMEVDEL